MKRYYFDRSEGGTTYLDDDGVEFEDDAAAERQAGQAAFDIAKDAARENLGFVRITLRDEVGVLIAVEVKYEIMRETRRVSA